MLAATGGVNTHRGAIFMLGLLCAAAGAALREQGGALHPAGLRDALRRHWGEALASAQPEAVRTARWHCRAAARPAQRIRRGGAGLPRAVRNSPAGIAGHALARGLTARQARLDALFHIIAVLDDSNLAHRGGLAGLRGAQRAAQGFLDRGGIARPQGLQEAQAIADDFVRQRLSPGGAADTLAAACWVQRVCPAP